MTSKRVNKYMREMEVKVRVEGSTTATTTTNCPCHLHAYKLHLPLFPWRGTTTRYSDSGKKVEQLAKNS